MTPNHFHCTCQTPPNVDLTEAYRLNFEASQTSYCPYSSSALEERPLNEKLLENLQTFGWSPISIRTSQIPKDAPLQQGDCETLWNNPKERISKLFAPGFCDRETPFPNATFRTSESGSAGESAVEPKQSWEVRRCTYYDKHNDVDETSSKNDNILNDMTQALHSIITAVESSLKLPSNLLVQEGFENDNSYGCSCLEKQKRQPCNVDLLRVFYYDKVEEERTNDDDDNKTLGSSPHTDWGTWTVVWQDTVGGLQTFCQSCQAWQDVPAPEALDDLLQFVIHVGDATSLAMGHALQKVRASNDIGNDGDGGDLGKVSWPSPLHRVLSPVLEPRASLVYFVYPPPGRSLASLSKGLVPWLHNHVPSEEHTRRPVIPFEKYFLLHDQSAGSNQVVRTPQDVLDSIFEKPMEQVFAEKWNQVQRTY